MPALRHIVIAESDSGVRALLARIVARTYSDCRRTVAPDGAAALAAVEAHGADLLLTGQRMPILSGLQVVRALRARQVAVPILLISSDPIEAAALGAGATRFLRKPFTLAEIQDALRDLLAH